MLLGATALAGLIAFVLCLPAVWAAPLNVDEEVTMAIAPRPFGEIWSIVWGKRGGGPLHFFLEHATLSWPGGLVGLRGPSIVFFLATLPAAALIARELAGRAAAVAAVLLLGAAPLAVSFATFGRPHVLLMAWIAWGLWLGLLAARDGGVVRWLAAALALAASAFVHPIGPLYAVAALAAALVYAERSPRAVGREAWPGVVSFALVLVPYYLHSVHVLKNRYGVGAGQRGRTYSGNSVLHDALTAVAPSTSHVVNAFTVAALAGAIALFVQRRGRAALVPVLLLAAPVVFFTFVPSHGRSALFFTRYMLPALPTFLALAGAGCSAAAGLLPRGRWVALGLLVALLGGLELRDNLTRIDQVRGLHLGGVVHAVREADATVFGGTGTIGRSGHIETLSYGRPPTLVDQYLALRIDGLDRVDDSSCVPAVRFLRAAGTPRRGAWVFYAARPDELRAGARALPRARLLDGGFLLVRSEPLAPPALLEEGLRLRRAWKRAVPRDFKVDYLIRADETALRSPASCKPLGEFDDPDITPARTIPSPGG
ncbi:MAG TPA: glycosyltransferase family 39 protein [Gaiellaceae bacterium]